MSYDNVCKYLAETYPEAFVSWLLSVEPTELQVLKTELSLEPIRADFVTFLQVDGQILHLEFQTSPESVPPLPFRMLDYSVRLKRQYQCDVEQVVLFLKPSNSPVVYTEEYSDRTTTHHYRVLRLWEQKPETFLKNPALLPFATLTQTDSPATLLQQVASAIDKIEPGDRRRDIAGCVEVIAGLKFDKDLIRQLLREEIMQESVIYQDILQKGQRQGRQEGLQEGRQEGRQQEASSLVIRQLNRRLGVLNSELLSQISSLSIDQLETLAEDLLDFVTLEDLIAWLNKQ